MCFAWVDYYPANTVLACTQYLVDDGSGTALDGQVAGLCLDSSQPVSNPAHPACWISMPTMSLACQTC